MRQPMCLREQYMQYVSALVMLQMSRPSTSPVLMDTQSALSRRHSELVRAFSLGSHKSDSLLQWTFSCRCSVHTKILLSASQFLITDSRLNQLGSSDLERGYYGPESEVEKFKNLSGFKKKKRLTFMYPTHIYKKIQMDSKTSVSRRVSSCNKTLATAEFFSRKNNANRPAFYPPKLTGC